LAKSNRVSCDRNRILPPGGCFGPEDPKRRPRDEMSLMVEGVVNGGMQARTFAEEIMPAFLQAPMALAQL
jgi:hypothetical protein